MTKDKCPSDAHFDPQQFGWRLQNIRKAQGITQEELADKLSVDRNHITRMERGIRVCSIDLLVEMAFALNVSTDYLLLGAAPTKRTKESLLIAIEALNKVVQSCK